MESVWGDMQGRVSIRTEFGWLVGLSSVSLVCMHGAGGSGALGVAGWERATRRCAFKSLSLSLFILLLGWDPTVSTP